VETLSLESPRSGPKVGDNRMTREADYRAMEAMHIDDRPVLPLPVPYSIQGSKAKVIDGITRLYLETTRYSGYGAAVRGELLSVAMMMAHAAEPGPNEAMVLFMGIEAPATQKNRSTSAVVRIDFKAVRIPAGIKDLEELEIEEVKQAKGEDNKLSG
jgi:hypothetical protein